MEPLLTEEVAYATIRREISRRKIKLRCSCCGGSRHTKEGCFKLVGYPDWWDDLRRRKATNKAPTHQTGGKANLASGHQPGPSLFEKSGMAIKQEIFAIDELEAKRKWGVERNDRLQEGKGRENTFLPHLFIISTKP